MRSPAYFSRLGGASGVGLMVVAAYQHLSGSLSAVEVGAMGGKLEHYQRCRPGAAPSRC